MRGRNNFNGESSRGVLNNSPLLLIPPDFADRGGPSNRGGNYNNDNNYRRNDSYDGGNMRGGRNNFNGELAGLKEEENLLINVILDRGGGNRGRYGNFNDGDRDEGFSGGRQHYGQNREGGGNYGNREERGFNNYGGNRGSHNRGGGGAHGGAGYDQERRTSESMSQLSLEGELGESM